MEQGPHPTAQQRNTTTPEPRQGRVGRVGTRPSSDSPTADQCLCPSTVSTASHNERCERMRDCLAYLARRWRGCGRLRRRRSSPPRRHRRCRLPRPGRKAAGAWQEGAACLWYDRRMARQKNGQGCSLRRTRKPNSNCFGDAFSLFLPSSSSSPISSYLFASLGILRNVLHMFMINRTCS